MTGQGAELRARREALGLSLDELSVATRIPAPHLEALEADRLEDLPRGPYAQAYLRTLREHLDLDEAEVEEPPPPAPPAGAPLWLVRLLAVTSVLALVGVIGWRVREQVMPAPAPGELPVVARVPDQSVVLVARRNVPVKVTVDGAIVEDRLLTGGERLEVAGHDRVEVELPALSAVGVVYNGETIVPQGQQEAPRTLVFVDDLQGEP